MADRLRPLRENPDGALVAATGLGLCLLVAGLGAVAVWAQFVGTWSSLFLMERAKALVAPVALGLLVTFLVAATVRVARL